MLKIEHVVLASPEQMEFIIEGMRNPMNSWDKSDSGYCGKEKHIGCVHCSIAGDEEHNEKMIKNDHEHGYGIMPCGKREFDGNFCLGHNDLELMKRLSKAGTDHRKFMRMMPVYARITAPLYFWKEFDTYKIGTVSNSCSTMHKIHTKEFALDDFSIEHMTKQFDDVSEQVGVLISRDYVKYDLSSTGTLGIVVQTLNACREKYLETKDKKYWWQMIQLLPSSYNQTRNVMMNYEVLANIYKSRRNHKLDEWHTLCDWIEDLPYSDLITGGAGNDRT